MHSDAADSVFQVRVYYEDTDHGGVVYHANYLRFMERARTEMLREKGYELDVLERDPGILFVVRRAHLDFRAPARFNDLLQIKSAIIHKTPVRMNFQQHISVKEKHLCSGEVEVVCLEAETFRPHVIPAELLQAFPLSVHP